MKKSKAALKTWSKKHSEHYTYGLTVHGSQAIDFWCETPRDPVVTVTTVKSFLSGELNHKVSQYLGEETLTEILKFLKRKFGED